MDKGFVERVKNKIQIKNLHRGTERSELGEARSGEAQSYTERIRSD
jgi:hypothetical protein